MNRRMDVDEKRMMKKDQPTWKALYTFCENRKWNILYNSASLFIWHFGAIVIMSVQLRVGHCSFSIIFCKYTHTKPGPSPAQPYISKTNFANSSKCGCELFRLSPSLYLSLGVYECVCLALYDFIWNLNVAICSDKKKVTNLINQQMNASFHPYQMSYSCSELKWARARTQTHTFQQWMNDNNKIQRPIDSFSRA